MFYPVSTILALLLIALDFSVQGVDVIQVDTPSEKECFGTQNGFGYSGTKQEHYDRLRRRYEGCTVVRGNLEITHLDDPTVTYDLGFLRSIRVVTGYVLIGLTTIDTMPLVSLQLIRGDNLYEIRHHSYALTVALTASVNGSAGMRQLLMPALREISRGQVMFGGNPLLCNVRTVLWAAIIKEHAASVVFGHMPQEQNCEECDESCTVEGERHCWGPGPNNCQHIPFPITCPDGCRSGCYQGNNGIRCCHSQCAGGCWGPSSDDCQLCRYFNHQGSCVRVCPPRAYPLGQMCIAF